MKPIHLTDELEEFLQEAVRSGRYASEESVISDALERLRQAISPVDAMTASGAFRAEQAKTLTKQQFQRHLVEIGLLEELSNRGGGNVGAPSSADAEEDILSEVVIRERLIEWLTGFLDK